MPGLEDPDLEEGEIAEASMEVVTKEDAGVVEADHLPCPSCGGEAFDGVCSRSDMAVLVCDATPLWQGGE